MLARLIRKAEEQKENNRARDQQPAKHLERVLKVSVVLPVRGRDLVDMRKIAVVVRLRPALPTFHGQPRIEHNNVRSYRNGAEYFDA